ncbi:glutamine-hydrolyzing carbamoyl-phosphate synthase small subunit [uncultured Clostridium sp.]|uniref:glutamine-hydrolyzing carbamoyl-phosphate synthase small subunit n=1 Tax=uncultured Clostridium sp. TaxID=59620 RepID=UPI0025DB4DB0|nr:glutamine-hydrolyzing carbamoyl-phosphate synthase small subunit [uncultured Clostridium sp.]
MNGILYLEDGRKYEGTAFGTVGTFVGEIVFNTSMTGYQEILTDPSYAGQIITMTYPLIGNYGVSSLFQESRGIFAKGFVVKSLCTDPSNWTNEKDLDQYLKEQGVIGLSGIDTRSITREIRDKGAMKALITSENLTDEELKDILENTKIDTKVVKEVSRKEVEYIYGPGKTVAVLDYGIKNNILENLKVRGCNLKVYPYNTSAEEILKDNPDGIFLSNGPGDPEEVPEAIENVKKLIGKKPIFGICLGHQIIALAIGAETYKLKYGHRGGNHGVYDIDRDRAYITSQNHGYAVKDESLEGKGMVITHRNLNDNTVEGMRHETLPLFSVQFHPEGAPGPEDSEYLFDKFIALMNE